MFHTQAVFVCLCACIFCHSSMVVGLTYITVNTQTKPNEKNEWWDMRFFSVHSRASVDVYEMRENCQNAKWLVLQEYERFVIQLKQFLVDTKKFHYPFCNKMFGFSPNPTLCCSYKNSAFTKILFILPQSRNFSNICINKRQEEKKKHLALE